uniref:Large ribosomal subunit protein uL29c n=1 Tax=Sciadococcus taiwanensis TaxID=3028030 RepID=A0A9Y1I2D1_9RHOD|nr:ribosomal protein L29 [Sciadococcus taiwanensis]
MSMPKIQEVRNLTNEEIQEEIILVKKQIFELKLKRSTRQAFKPHLFRHAHHRLSQLFTVKREREIIS